MLAEQQSQCRSEPILLALAEREAVRDAPLSVDENEQVRVVDETRVAVARARESEVVESPLDGRWFAGQQVDPLEVRCRMPPNANANPVT